MFDLLCSYVDFENRGYTTQLYITTWDLQIGLYHFGYRIPYKWGLKAGTVTLHIIWVRYIILCGSKYLVLFLSKL